MEKLDSLKLPMDRFLLAARVFRFLCEELTDDTADCPYQFSLPACQRVFARRADLRLDRNLLDLVSHIEWEIRVVFSFLEENPQLARETEVEIAPLVSQTLSVPDPQSPNFGGEMRERKRCISFATKFFGAFASGRVTEEMLR